MTLLFDYAIEKEDATINPPTCTTEASNALTIQQMLLMHLYDRFQNEHFKMKTSNYTAYFCIDISDMPSTNLGNTSSVNDFIFDFTTSSTSSSHGNKGRLCVNTDHQHTLPFTNMVVYCDDKTNMFLVTKSDTHTWEDVDILYSNKMHLPHIEQVLESDACLGVESECMSNTFKRNGANVSSCSDPQLETIDIGYADSHTIGLRDAIVITSCTFTNNTSSRGALSIASGCDYHAYYKLDSVFITSCVFTVLAIKMEGIFHCITQ